MSEKVSSRRAEWRRWRFEVDADLSAKRLRHGLDYLRALWFLRGCTLEGRAFVGTSVKVRNEGRIFIGDRAYFWEGMIPQELICSPGGELRIGPGSMFNYGSSVGASGSVRIGARCMFGSYAHIHDLPGKPIVIGDDVWVAHGAVVEPGCTIGDRSVIAAGAVVSGEVPPMTLAVGSPATLVPLKDDEG